MIILTPFQSVMCMTTEKSIFTVQKVSFCVIDKDLVMPEESTTYFRSVIAFGRIWII